MIRHLHRLRTRPTRAAVAVLSGMAFLTACGSSSPPIELGSLPPSTSSPPTTTPTTVAPAITTAPVSTEAPITQPWSSATANLAGLSSECGNMSYVTARPDRDVLYAGIAKQGLWSSTDGGASWVQLGQGGGSDKIENRTSSIVFDPEDPNRFWQSGIYGPGVYRTDDDGQTFQRLGDVEHVDEVSVDLSDPERNTLLTGTHERSTAFLSTDGGDTWRDITGSLGDEIGAVRGVHVIDANTFLLGTTVGAASGVYRTTDGGKTWTQVHQGAVHGAPLAASDGAIYWLLMDGAGVIRSDDQGVTWTQTLGPGGVATNAESLLELPDGRLATFGATVITSADRGVSWRPLGPNFPYQPSGLAYSPTRNTFYIWHFDCEQGTDNPVPANAIMQLPMQP
jgi:photosystem II stability/assembly factor-like uncharacterized protein